MVPGVAFSLRSVNVNTSPSQWASGNRKDVGPIVSHALLHHQARIIPSTNCPLDRRRRLAGNVADGAVEAAYLVGDAVTDPRHEVGRQVPNGRLFSERVYRFVARSAATNTGKSSGAPANGASV